LNDIEFGGWDIFEDNAYEAAVKAGFSDESIRSPEGFSLVIRPMSAVFTRNT